MSSAIQPDPISSAQSRLAALVLAAGYSSRMGEFKPLLPLGNATAFERSIGLFRAAGVEEVIAVLGHRAEELRPLAERCGARCVVNLRFDRGMFSSIVAGIRALPHCVDAAFILPADIPLVRVATVRQLARTWAASDAGILYPVFSGRRGHPPLIRRQILNDALAAGFESPLSTLLAGRESDALEVRVADRAIHMDMDTQADYHALLSLDARWDIPNRAECEEILDASHVAPHIIRHSRKVTEIANRIASALQQSGLELELNLKLVHAGALLDDLAKGQPDHAAVGASALRALGFDRVADVVAEHTELSAFSRLDETAIVYLSDKLVSGEDLVTLAQRFEPALIRFASDPAAQNAARKRMRIAQQVAGAVESRVGASLECIVNGESSSNKPIADAAKPDYVGAR